MNELEKQQMLKEIIMARIKTMSSNTKIGIGSKGDFLDRDQMLNEINSDSTIGNKILNINYRYLKALKEGLI